ncbi:hypothetical protein FD755_010358 [Muntiacus reevesi]|uniref:Vezatin n=1 Tax=Muntiacus reevesi TaxID=9886 RepID=A0A5N3XY36_MUNRE|nr:hypothetical protein FD755_010358 [Muntiacus reevesi]
MDCRYQASLSITNSWSLLKFISIQSVMPSSRFILCFQGTLKSLLQHHSSEASILRHSTFFMKVGKTIPFRYDLNQNPYDYTVEMTNTFKELDLIVPGAVDGENFRKTSTSALLTMLKTLTVWITTNWESSSRDGNTRPPDLPPEKSMLGPWKKSCDQPRQHVCLIPSVLFQLWVAQSSEFFRRLALLLSTTNSPPGPLLTPALLPHRILSDVTQGLPHAHSACLEELKRSYEFYRYFETQHQSVPQRLSRTQQKSRELSNVHTAVRSLQLHLKALLNEVIILEDELEKLVCTKETQELVSEAYQILEQKLKLIQPHVQASNNCWEEAISQVDKLLRRNTDKKGQPEMACENPRCTVVPLTQPPLHIADEDPIPEEQELEAYVDDIDMDTDFRKDDFYYLSQEDRERQKREHEESKRVLQELKSVLGFKASEAERQKWKQLLFSDHAVLKSLSPVDPVEPISNSEPSVDSDMGKVGKNDTEEENNKTSTADNEISSRTEYLCEYPLDGKNKDNSANEVFFQGAEERAHYECEREDESPQADVDGLAPAHPAPRVSSQPAIKQRLAQLQLSPDFTFTAGLAAEVAARSLSFTTMQEQTFGDEEEEHIIQENENEVEEK